ncbi:MAG: phosphoketolase family protein [Panacagrimonas sp.]
MNFPLSSLCMNQGVALSADDLGLVDRWWRAANYLSVGQIYLLDNPLLERPLVRSDVKPRLLGHWGTTPGLNFIYAHLNRAILRHDAEVLFIAGPGHGGPAMVANAWLEGTYTERYPEVTRDAEGLRRLFRQFSFPGGIPSHASPEIPGSLHEGGELGYSLSHAFGAAFDNPEIIVACVIGDGEAETGPLATAWHSNKFLDARRDGAVLPILHLNGYKIASPTVLSRIPRDELEQLLRGYGWEPVFVDVDRACGPHRPMAEAVDAAIALIRAIQHAAASDVQTERPRWPMIVLVSPKGWTGPASVDGQAVEGSWRSHQVPVSDLDSPAHLAVLDAWLRSYRASELLDPVHGIKRDLAGLAPNGNRRMSAHPSSNGGGRVSPPSVPDVGVYEVALQAPGAVIAESTRVQGRLLRDVIRANPRTFRIFSPDETTSNRWDAVLEATERCFVGAIQADDDHLAAAGRVMEVLSEHQCQGWLEGYVLTGRHGFLSCYEAFIQVVASMYIQHAKWLQRAREVSWRVSLPPLNVLLTSHVWRQDHNGSSHQDPGFLDLIANRPSEIVRIFLPPDANTLLCVTSACLTSLDRINVVVAGKQPAPQWLTLAQAREHCAAGVGIWAWASHEGEPDVVMACCGDVPTMETLAAVQWLRDVLPDLRVRVVNVVDLLRLCSPRHNPDGLTEEQYAALFGTDVPVVFAFHGYPSLVHRLTYDRANHEQMHVHGYCGEGTTTTPFDMTVLNRLDRFHLALAVVERAAAAVDRREALRARLQEQLAEHARHVRATGEDLPEVREWRWHG